MATFASLTPVQQTRLSDFQLMSRGTMRQFVVAVNQLAAEKQLWDNNISAVASLLSAGEVIPDASGYAGADQMKIEDLSLFTVVMNAVLTTYNASNYQTFYARVVGLQNAAANT